MDDDLAITSGTERMTDLLESGAQFSIIVNLAVADDVDLPIFARERLLPGGYVDNGESTHSQACCFA
jgi:hypothetical protein